MKKKKITIAPVCRKPTELNQLKFPLYEASDLHLHFNKPLNLQSLAFSFALFILAQAQQEKTTNFHFSAIQSLIKKAQSNLLSEFDNAEFQDLLSRTNICISNSPILFNTEQQHFDSLLKQGNNMFFLGEVLSTGDVLANTFEKALNHFYRKATNITAEEIDFIIFKQESDFKLFFQQLNNLFNDFFTVFNIEILATVEK